MRCTASTATTVQLPDELAFAYNCYRPAIDLPPDFPMRALPPGMAAHPLLLSFLEWDRSSELMLQSLHRIVRCPRQGDLDLREERQLIVT